MPPPKKFLTDEEMAALEQQPSAGPPAFIPDEAAAPQPQPELSGIASASQAPPPSRELQPATKAQSAGRGSLAYGSFNFGDEISAGVGAGLYGLAKGVRSILPGGVPEDAPSVGDVYSRILEGERTAYDSAKSAHPAFYHGAGIATSALQVPGVAKLGQVSNAARIAQLAATGGVTAGLAAAGEQEGGIGDRLGHGARGAVYGALLAPAGDAAVRGLGALSGSIAAGARRVAGNALSRVAGGIQRDVAAAGGSRAFEEAGLEGFQRGLIRPFDYLPGAIERQADRVAGLARQSTDDIVNAIDDAGARISVQPIKQAFLNASSKLRQFEDANPAALSKMDGIIRGLEKNADAAGTVSARTLQTAKEVIDDWIKTWDPFGKSGLAQGLNKSLYGAVREAQEVAVEAGSGTAGRAVYETAKRSSSLAQKLEGFQDSYARRQANALSTVGGLHGALGSMAGIAQAIASGDPLQGLAYYAGTRFLTSPRTAAIGALGAQKAASVLPAYAQSAVNPMLARSAAQAIVASLEDR